MNARLPALLLAGVSTLSLMACTQLPAQVVDKGKQFFGKTHYAQDMSLRMPQNPRIAAKYSEPTFERAAPMDSIAVAETLPPPEPVVLAELPEVKEESVPFQVARAQDTVIKPTLPQAEPQPEMVRVSYEPVKSERVVVQPAPVAAAPVEEVPQLAALPLDSAQMQQVLDREAPSLSSLNERNSNFIWPVEGKVVSGFGPKKNGLVNDGINIAAQEGEPIWSAAEGQVVYAGNELKGYGNMMIIRHANGWMTAYAHASDMLVTKGDRVKQGDLIGYVGKTGSVKTAQLHFGVRQGKKPVDPQTLLPRRVASAK